MCKLSLLELCPATCFVSGMVKRGRVVLHPFQKKYLYNSFFNSNNFKLYKNINIYDKIRIIKLIRTYFHLDINISSIYSKFIASGAFLFYFL